MPQTIAAIIDIKITEPIAIAISPPTYPRKLLALKISFPLLPTNV